MTSKSPVGLNPLAMPFDPSKAQSQALLPAPRARIVHRLATSYFNRTRPPSPTSQDSQEDSPILSPEQTAHTSVTPHENFFIKQLIDRWKSSPLNQKVWAFYQHSLTSELVILKTDDEPFLEWTTTPIIDETLEEISAKMDKLGYTPASKIASLTPYRTICAEIGTLLSMHQINYLTAVLPDQTPLNNGDCGVFKEGVVKVVQTDLEYAIIRISSNTNAMMQVPLAELKKLNTRFSLASKIIY